MADNLDYKTIAQNFIKGVKSVDKLTGEELLGLQELIKKYEPNSPRSQQALAALDKSIGEAEGGADINKVLETLDASYTKAIDDAKKNNLDTSAMEATLTEIKGMETNSSAVTPEQLVTAVTANGNIGFKALNDAGIKGTAISELCKTLSKGNANAASEAAAKLEAEKNKANELKSAIDSAFKEYNIDNLIKAVENAKEVGERKTAKSGLLSGLMEFLQKVMGLTGNRK